MKAWMAFFVLFVVQLGCEEEFKPPPKDEKAQAKAAKELDNPPEPKIKEEPAKEEPPKAKAPDPSEPKAIAEARNVAILDGRMEDALRLCGKEDLAKTDSQGVLGCVLTACRLEKSEQAGTWAKHLKGPLLKEARKVCAAGGVGPL